jgi:hypothetical protein
MSTKKQHNAKLNANQNNPSSFHSIEFHTDCLTPQPEWGYGEKREKLGARIAQSKNFYKALVTETL